MGMSAPAHGGSGVRPGINITPLVDVAVVVLIIFMVVAPMVFKTFTLNVPPPTSAAGAPPPEGTTPPVELVLQRDGSILLNRQKVAAADLGGALPPLLAAARPQVLTVAADDRLPYGQVIEVLDAARAAGARTISVVTHEKTER